MSIYNLMNEALYCRDLINCGSKLINFADAALKEKNRATLVKMFYERLSQATIIDYAFDGFLEENRTHYVIYESENVVGKVLYLLMPPKNSPVKTLNEIRNFGEYLLRHYRKPVGKSISRKRVNEIMQYLDSRFDFSSKVFSNKRVILCLLDYSHSELNSECLIFNAKEDVVQHFLIYHMKDNEEEISPEAVFFHELGHALHAKCFGNIDSVPETIISFLKDLCMPRIDEITEKEQVEVFADILSVGLIYDSPFIKYEPFPSMHEDDKKVFKMLVEKMLSNI